MKTLFCFVIMQSLVGVTNVKISCKLFKFISFLFVFPEEIRAAFFVVCEQLPLSDCVLILADLVDY